jgi:hypothetical protein
MKFPRAALHCELCLVLLYITSFLRDAALLAIVSSYLHGPPRTPKGPQETGLGVSSDGLSPLRSLTRCFVEFRTEALSQLHLVASQMRSTT